MLLSTESSRPRVIDTLSDEALNFHAKSREKNCWMKKNASAKFSLRLLNHKKVAGMFLLLSHMQILLAVLKKYETFYIRCYREACVGGSWM